MTNLVRITYETMPCLQGQCTVATLTLNRPERANALVPELVHQLLHALEDVRDQTPDVLVLQAAGKTFSTGGDVTAFYQQPNAVRAEYASALVGSLHDAILALTQLPCPTVAKVHGLVTGGSLGLVLACDVVIGTWEAQFAPWYARVGFAPDGGWTALLPERIGRTRSLDLLLTNRTLAAEEAHHLGLLTYLVSATELTEATHEVVQQITTGYRSSHRHTLTLMRPEPIQLAAKLRAEQHLFCQQIMTPDADHGMAAFLTT
ncbi:enoyl-CoA hydratase/isomerase family protein [Salinispirillum sp. LH 10-3-1]|uniref:Enoyl-CoA hydratase/isomerase family protein n=1 Tax=Salinispirillum sp. LH 10-3-1 TaxID=2952525 RepID=A0AB38YJE4_9GAMM